MIWRRRQGYYIETSASTISCTSAGVSTTSTSNSLISTMLRSSLQKRSPTSKHRTGTLAFMAIDLIRNAAAYGQDPPIPHLVRYDYESVFWLDLWSAMALVKPGTEEEAKAHKNKGLGDCRLGADRRHEGAHSRPGPSRESHYARGASQMSEDMVSPVGFALDRCEPSVERSEAQCHDQQDMWSPSSRI